MKDQRDVISSKHDLLDWTIEINRVVENGKIKYVWTGHKKTLGINDRVLHSRKSWSREIDALEDATSQINGETVKNDVIPAIAAAIRRFFKR